MGTDVAFRPVVIAPSYNNERTVRGVLERVVGLGLPVIAVNDGATDGTAAVLAEWAGGRRDVRVVTHEVNRGKGEALRTGFREAAAMGYTHAATIDTDGQLDPEQIPALLVVAAGRPEALVLGYRDDEAADYPRRSRVGRRVSNTFVWMESGVRVRDSQCGFRVYPLGLVDAVRCRAGRYGFETEVVVRAGWAGCEVVEVPVRCRYFAGGERVSHFRPWVDSWRGVGMHVRLLARAMWPGKHVRWPGGEPVRRESIMGGLVEWVSPVRAWRQLREGEYGTTETAAGVAVGIFIANLPLYGVQTLLALYTARRLHLHPLPVVAGSQLSTPPVGVAMVFGAIVVGHVMLHGALPRWEGFDATRAWEMGWPLLVDWAVGSLVLGFVMAVGGFFVVNALLRLVQRRGNVRGCLGVREGMVGRAHPTE
jgi:uncharacterized protein (DUF2062 family)